MPSCLFTTTNPSLVRAATQQDGSTSVIGSIDHRKDIYRRQQVYSATGVKTRRKLVDHCKFLADELGRQRVRCTGHPLMADSE
ncbi:MAG: hypothetical protein WKF55_07510 [Gemmatimonadaceae bacterium]